MSDDTAQLILEHLRHIRARVDRIDGGLLDVRQRMISLEASMTRVKLDGVAAEEVNARQQLALDELNHRVDRIERRLDLIEP